MILLVLVPQEIAAKKCGDRLTDSANSSAAQRQALPRSTATNTAPRKRRSGDTWPGSDAPNMAVL